MAIARLTKVCVRNFRSLKHIDIDVETYTSFIGKNNTGKSALLRAIELLFEPTEKWREEDWCHIDFAEGDEAYIEATFSNVPDNTPYAHNHEIRFRLDAHMSRDNLR